MPELPEVEVVRRGLERELVGKRIVAVEATGTRSIRRHGSPEEFEGFLRGRQVRAIERRGKYLAVYLDDDQALVIHLGMSGRLLWSQDPAEAAPKHTHVVITTEPSGTLRFVDPRTFGEMFVTPVGADRMLEALAHLGPDALEVTSETFARALQRRTTKLKPLLMEQRFVAGIGNIYSDEILYAAGLRWDRAANTLDAAETQRLHRAMGEILHAAIGLGGSSLADAQYVDLYGRTGTYATQHQVFAREGEPCPRCAAPIRRERTGGRSTFFCESCRR